MRIEEEREKANACDPHNFSFSAKVTALRKKALVDRG